MRSMTIVLARRHPASLACDFASARGDMHHLVEVLGDSRTYRSGRRADEARHLVKTVARQLRRISRRLYIGPCGHARRHNRLGNYVSVHVRDALDDGGLRTVARELAHISRVLQKVGPWSGASMVVRDSSGESTASRMGEICQSLAAVLATIVLDLTAADLTGIDPNRLTPIHALWSSGTLWHPGVADRIRTSSREVGPGIYLV